jgi:hypothetical protein
MSRRELIKRIPGWVATTLVVLVTSAWTLWGVVEMYYEGWWGPWSVRVPYLVPALCCLGLSLVAVTWPRMGGWLLVGIGGGFTAWWWTMSARRGLLTPRIVVGTFPVSGLLVVTGVLFLLEGRRRRRLKAGGREPSARWARRYTQQLAAVGVPLLVAVAISGYWLPTVLSRLDDGGRDARLIEGNGVTLVWAPAGPGWSRGLDVEARDSQPAPGPGVSWNDLAWYGAPPVGFGDKPAYEGGYATAEEMESTGLCRYLSADGQTLCTEPQDVWRLPTTQEIVRSLVRDGAHAGCTWDGLSGSARCDVTPDKETPLWVPSWPPIYYWSGEQYDEHEAYYVSYNGSIISYQDKSWGNPRHGYRCVREP